MLTAENISASYNDKPVFSGISFSLKRNTRLLVTGKNGSGKTTLCKTAAGIRDVNKGKITGTGGTSLSSPCINPFRLFTVDQMIKFTGLSQVCKNNFYSLLNTLEGPSSHIQLSALSSGSRQKVMISLALCADTSTVILDEPFIHLDEHSRSVLIRVIRKQNRNLILTSHTDCSEISPDIRLSLDEY